MTSSVDEFVWPWRARYYEVDQQGVVFNAWYLAWFDEAMSAFLDRVGLDPAALVRAGIEFKLVHAELDWRAGVRWGEDVELVVRLGRIGRTSFEMTFAVRRAGAEICASRIVYVCVRRDGSGPTPVPDRLCAALRGPAASDGAGRAQVLERVT